MMKTQYGIAERLARRGMGLYPLDGELTLRECADVLGKGINYTKSLRYRHPEIRGSKGNFNSRELLKYVFGASTNPNSTLDPMEVSGYFEGMKGLGINERAKKTWSIPEHGTCEEGALGAPGGYKILPWQEQKFLFKMYQTYGDEYARNALIAMNMPLVYSIAKRFSSTKDAAFSSEDLAQEGMLGLVHALDKFDLNKKTRFSTYAMWWIRQYMSRAIENQSDTVRIPAHRHTDRKRIQRWVDNFRQEKEREPTIKEISSGTNIREYYVKTLLNLKPISLDSPVGSDEESDELYSVFAGSEEGDINQEVYRDDERRAIGVLMRALDKREHRIVSKYFGLYDDEPKTLQAIGNEFGISRERVRQLNHKALMKMRICAKRLNINADAFYL